MNPLWLGLCKCVSIWGTGRVHHGSHDDLSSHLLCGQDINTRNFFPWQDIPAFEKKILPLARNFFLWKEISALAMRFLYVTRNFFLWQLIICSATMLLLVTRKYLWHVVFVWYEEFLHWTDRKYLEVKFTPKQRELLPKFCVSLAPWLPGNIPPCLVEVSETWDSCEERNCHRSSEQAFTGGFGGGPIFVMVV